MFSGIATLRDLVLYVICGNLTVFLLIRILSDFYQINLISNFSVNINNLALLLAFTCFSTLIGFVQSGFIIFCFNKLLSKFAKNSFNLEHLPVRRTIETQLIAKIKKTFKLKEDIKIEETRDVFPLVNFFVVLRTNPHTYWYAERLIAFSHIYCTIPIPIIVGLFYLFTKLQLHPAFEISLWLLFSGLIAYFCFYQSYQLRKAWIDVVYKLFYNLPDDKPNTSEKKQRPVRYGQFL
jgi:hypothetical protein